jgi:hypothetical protein
MTSEAQTTESGNSLSRDPPFCLWQFRDRWWWPLLMPAPTGGMMSHFAGKTWRLWWLLLLLAPPPVAALLVPLGYVIGEWLWDILPMPWAAIAEIGMLILPSLICGGLAVALVALLHSRGSRTLFGIIYAIETFAMFCAMSYPLSFYITAWK